ncbi:MAG: biopolymer transporter ExbD [Myxococcota bacterium]
MAGGAMGGDDDDLITDINVTPLVDVVLVLLIILMVTATAIVSKTIPMELPQAATPEETPTTPTTFAISIDADGKLYLDRDEVTSEELRTRVRAAHNEDPDVRAIIAADGRIQHANVVRVIDLLRQEQVTKFAINVRPADLEGGE